MEDLTVQDWLCQHVDMLVFTRPQTTDGYRAIIRNDIPPILLDKPLTALTGEDVARWVKHLQARGLAASTVRGKYQFLSAALKHAVAVEHLTANPARSIRIQWAAPRTATRHLTREQFVALRAAFSEHYRPFVTFLVASGCRFGEATALRPGDVDSAAGTVHIDKTWVYRSGHPYELGEPKTRNSVRIINITPSVLNQLDYSHEWLFTTKWGNPLRMQNFHPKNWKPAVTRADLGFRPRIHDLRHTCATWMIQAGVSMQTVSDHLGHKSIATTMDTYSHVERSAMKAAADTLGEFLPNL